MDLSLNNSADSVFRQIRKSVINTKIFAAVVGVVLLVLVPYIHLGILYTAWNIDKTPVDKSSCVCPCWDTLFKGSYEKGSKPRYKHIYFNLTHQTLKIWALSAVAFILFYESVKKLCILIKGDQARWSMVILFCSVIYPHYYGWWMYFNAWNDDFYDQWYHQAFFSLTELASTIVVFYFCDNERLLQPRLLLFIMDIAILHILASGGDQFISNVILKKGAWFQFTRDIGFMIPDLLHIVIPAFELRRLKNQRGARFWDIFSHSDIFLSIFLISVLWFIVSHL